MARDVWAHNRLAQELGNDENNASGSGGILLNVYYTNPDKYSANMTFNETLDALNSGELTLGVLRSIPLYGATGEYMYGRITLAALIASSNSIGLLVTRPNIGTNGAINSNSLQLLFRRDNTIVPNT